MSDCVAFEVLVPPLDMHARNPRRFDLVYALCDEIQALEQATQFRRRTPLWYAVESLGRIASDVASLDRDNALQALLKVRELQARV